MLTAVSHNDNPAFANIFREKMHKKNLNNDGNKKVNLAKHTRFAIFVIIILNDHCWLFHQSLKNWPFSRGYWQLGTPFSGQNFRCREGGCCGTVAIMERVLSLLLVWSHIPKSAYYYK